MITNKQQAKIDEELFRKSKMNSNCNLGPLSWIQINNTLNKILEKESDI